MDVDEIMGRDPETWTDAEVEFIERCALDLARDMQRTVHKLLEENPDIPVREAMRLRRSAATTVNALEAAVALNGPPARLH